MINGEIKFLDESLFLFLKKIVQRALINAKYTIIFAVTLIMVCHVSEFSNKFSIFKVILPCVTP